MIGWEKNLIRENKKKRDNQSFIVYCGVDGIEKKSISSHELTNKEKFIVKESKQVIDLNEKNLYLKIGF